MNSKSKSITDRDRIKIIETPRDGFQSLDEWIPTEVKVAYINSLLRVGFDTVEVGSFVSPKYIPQMKDTGEVLSRLDLGESKSKIMVLVGNIRGCQQACEFPQIDEVIYPYSISPAFLKRNLNATIAEARATASEMIALCEQHHKELIVYLTLAFGNPYGDPWSIDLLIEEAEYLRSIGRKCIPLSDTLGTVSPGTLSSVLPVLTGNFPGIEFGVHLHCRPGEGEEKIKACWEAGIRRFDSVTGGFGGCPMASDEMVSNLDTFELIGYCGKNDIPHNLDLEALDEAKRFLNSKF